MPSKRDTPVTVSEEEEVRDAVYRALCANHLTRDVAEFLANLNSRVGKLEQTIDPPRRKRGKSNS